MKVKSLEAYQQHIKVFHQKKTAVTVQNNQTNNCSEDLFLKCPVPGCNYKTRNKSSLRSHRFWHPSEPSPSSTVENPKEQSVSKDDNFEVENIPLVLEHISSQPDLSSEVDPSSACNVYVLSDTLEDSLTKKLTHMSLTLSMKYHVPDSTVAHVLGTYSTLLRESSSITGSKLIQELNSCSQGMSNDRVLQILSEDPLLKLHGPEGPLRSYYCRQKQYNREFPYVKPRQISLGLNDENIQCKYHYVSIKDSLQRMFKDDSVYEQYLENIRRSVLVPPDDLTDITSGSVYYENKLFSKHPDSIQIILFQDDVELCKALGAAAGSFKVNHMAFTIGNLHPWNRSKVDPLQLVLLCKEKDVDYFGLPEVLKPVLKDLQDLETNGIEIRGKNVKASVLVLLGDNLGTHTIGGYMESFATTIYFCRYCEESRSEWNARWNLPALNDTDCESVSDSDSDSESDSDSDSESVASDSAATEEDSDSDDDVPLADLVPLSTIQKRLKRIVPWRTVESYKACLDKLDAHPKGVKGVVADCELNKLKYFHIVGQSPPCYHHDAAEGFARHDIRYCLDYLMDKYKFSMTDVDRKFSAFAFKGTDKLDKPPRKQPKKKGKIKGNAVQVLTFIRFLPLIIGKFITDKNDPAWLIILTLIHILQLVSSPVVSRSSNSYIDEQIMKYLTLRTKLFPLIPLRPKHHFFEHYAFLLLR